MPKSPKRPPVFHSILNAAALVLLAATAAWGTDSVGLAVRPAPAVEASGSPPPLRLAEGLSAEAVHELRRATEGAVDAVEAMKSWNASGRPPVRIGFTRPLARPVHLRLDAAAFRGAPYRPHLGGFIAESFAGNPVWGTSVRVRDAWRLRLHLEDVNLPAGTRLWVWGLGGEPRPFGLELASPGGDVWTPSVSGEVAFLEIELPAGSLDGGGSFGFRLTEVGEAFRLGADGSPVRTPIFEPLGECLEDASCFGAAAYDVIDLHRKAVAHLQFVNDGVLQACSGGLLNDRDASTFIPFLLTANHCFSTPAAASSLEAFWDFRTSSCGGAVPSLDSLPRSNGSTLLATGTSNDFTFVRLTSAPGERVFLGWTTAPPAHGTALHRISHPFPESFIHPQSYSRATVDTSFAACPNRPRPRYIYQRSQIGGVFTGSSGSPVTLDGGAVVGQMRGTCGLNPADGCDDATRTFDGAFAVTYPQISRFLENDTPDPGPTGPCVPSATTLCIDDQPGDQRFQVTVRYQTTQGGGLSGPGTAIPLNGLGVTAGGLFWFFDAKNPEMLVKVLNGCAATGDYWVFYAAGTNVGLTTTVVDTRTGRSKVYTNPDRNPAPPVQDLNAFDCN